MHHMTAETQAWHQHTVSKEAVVFAAADVLQ